MPFILAAIVIIIVIAISNMAIVQQSQAYVIESLGAFKEVWGVGWHIKIPFIERIVKIFRAIHG